MVFDSFFRWLNRKSSNEPSTQVIPGTGDFTSLGRSVEPEALPSVDAGHYLQVDINESLLDEFGHLNNATFLVLAEAARRAWLADSGYGVSALRADGLGLFVLEITISYQKEITSGESIFVATTLVEHSGKVGILKQPFYKADGTLAADMTLKYGIFSEASRRLVPPPAKWKAALNLE